MKCPISFKLMIDPVTAPDGMVSRWLDVNVLIVDHFSIHLHPPPSPLYFLRIMHETPCKVISIIAKNVSIICASHATA